MRPFDRHCLSVYQLIYLVLQFSLLTLCCEGTLCVVGIGGAMLIPRQLRFSFYSGAVITEGLM